MPSAEPASAQAFSLMWMSANSPQTTSVMLTVARPGRIAPFQASMSQLPLD